MYPVNSENLQKTLLLTTQRIVHCTAFQLMSKIRRRNSIKHLATLVNHHQVPLTPTHQFDLHTKLKHTNFADDGYSESASNNSDETPRPISPKDKKRQRSPSNEVKNPHPVGSPEHHHHHHHHHQQHLQPEGIHTHWNEEETNVLHKAVGHFGRSVQAMAVNKWHEFIELQIWNNLSLKARNICNSTPMYNLSLKQLNVVTEWIDGICEDIFSNVSNTQLRELIKGSEFHEVKDGEPLFYQGEVGQHYWIVLSGEIRIAVLESNTAAVRRSSMYKRRKSWLDTEETETPTPTPDLGHTVYTAGPGVGFGQIALISNKPIRSGSCIASRDGTTLLAIPKLIYKQHLEHLHEAEKNLDERVDYLHSLDRFKGWNHARLMHLAFAIREKTFFRGEIVLDGRKISKTSAKSNDDDDNNDASQMDLLIIKDGLVEYSRYLTNSKKNKNKQKPQKLGICGPGRVFDAPGGTVDSTSSHLTVVKALRATKVYSIPKGYFSTATSKSRADMQSAKSMFRRECDEHSQIQTKRARNIQQGIKTEQELLRFSANPVSEPALSTLDTGTLEANYPYPNEGTFSLASKLTYERLTKHDFRKLTHVAELNQLNYQDTNNVPPWATGTPIVLIGKQKKNRKKKKHQLPTISSQNEMATRKKQNEKSKKTGSVKWRMEEPAIVLRTQELFKNFRTQDSTNILMGIKVD